MKQSAPKRYVQKSQLSNIHHVDDIQDNYLSIFNIPIWNGKLRNAVDWIMNRISLGAKTRIGFANANNLNIAYKDVTLSEHYQTCHRVFADGSGVKIASKIAGDKVVDNVNGTDMLPLLCRQLEKSGKRVFFVGGKDGVAESMVSQLAKKFPKLIIAGFHHGYLNNEVVTQKIINQINQSKAELLLVAMGTPIQENWITKNESKIKTSVIMSVGGLFDFYSGNIKRAPIWMRKVGVEWVWRLLQEPSRMWQRYILGNPLFIYRVLFELIKTKLNKKKIFSYSKRCFDFCASAIGLTILSPIFLVISACIKADTSGKVFYSQLRVGKKGKTFKFWKFRSMVVGAHQQKSQIAELNESKGNVLFKIKNDPRVTCVGKILRRYSLDELPQLWNVLKGDMSLVGPRPSLPEEAKLYSKEDRKRCLVKPGITCYWQIKGRSNLSFSQQMKLDKRYINDRSFLTDLKILLGTIPAVISGEGAC